MDLRLRRRQHLVRLCRHLDDASLESMIDILAIEDVDEIAVQEEYVLLIEFAGREPCIFVDDDPVGYDAGGNLPALVPEKRLLSARVQVAIWNLLQAVNDLFQVELCPEALSRENVILSRETMSPRLVHLKLQKITPEGVKRCGRQLSALIDADLIRGQGSGKKMRLPAEINHLLVVMKENLPELLQLALFHPSLVPIENRTEYFMRVYGHIKHVLSTVDKEGYEFVLENLAFPEEWEALVQNNMYLASFYASVHGTGYDPKGLESLGATTARHLSSEEKLKARKVAASENLRFNRNMPAHGLDLSPDTTKPHGMKFSPKDMAVMLYGVAEGSICSAATCLARMNLLECLDLPSLFPGRVFTRKG